MKRFLDSLRPLVSTVAVVATILAPFSPLSALPAQTADIGPNNPGTVVDSSAIGSFTWSNPDRAKTSNNSYATTTISDNTNRTHYLKATDFGITIPADATIVGIEVGIERHQACAASGCTSVVSDNTVRLVKSGTVVGTNEASATAWPTSDATAVYGGPTDLWGTTWSVADVNNTGTGVVLSADRTSGGSRVVSVDAFTMRVYYHQPDFTATKTNNVDGVTAPSGTFTWTIRVQNIGDGSGTFNSGEVSLQDEMPFGADFSNYGGPVVTTSGLTGSGHIQCLNTGSDDENLVCKAIGGGVTFPAGSYFDVAVQAHLNASASGTIFNPRSGGVCRVDPDNHVTEIFGGNNFCGDSVVVVQPTPTPPTTGTVIVNKVVVGGHAAVSTFQLFVGDQLVTSGASNAFLPGQYQFSEINGNAEEETYQATYSEGCSGGVISVVAGLTLTCTVTNTLAQSTPTPTPSSTPTPTPTPSSTPPPTAYVIVAKHTIGGDGTFHFNGLVEGGFNLTTSVATDHWASEAYNVLANQGGTPYTITENVPEGWTLTSVSCVYENESNGNTAQNGETIIVDPGDEVTCTFTNTAIVPETPTPTPTPSNGHNSGSLVIKKVVVGSDASPSEFQFTLNGEQDRFNASGENSYERGTGNYMVAEVPTDGYTVTYSGDCTTDGQVTIQTDAVVTCVVTNTYTGPQLSPTPSPSPSGEPTPSPTPDIGVGGGLPDPNEPHPSTSPTPKPTSVGNGSTGGNGGITGGGSSTPTPSPSPVIEPTPSNDLTAAIGDAGGLGAFLAHIGWYWWLLPLTILLILYWLWRRQQGTR